MNLFFGLLSPFLIKLSEPASNPVIRLELLGTFFLDLRNYAHSSPNTPKPVSQFLIQLTFVSHPTDINLLTYSSTVGLSKKDARSREQKKKEELGIKVETTKGGVVKKAPKATIQCTVCKGSFIESMPIILRDHAAKHEKLKTPQECFPGATIAQ
ncbi:hypothetical protein JCM3765_002121 [Sporobolomyces pararoseus]